MDQHSNREQATSLVKGGTAAIAGGILPVCQQLFGDPAAVFGLGIANAVMPVLIDYGARSLSLDERRRIDHVATHTLTQIQAHLSAGHEPRKDGFFNISSGARSSAQELCEGILEISRAEHQEAKLPYVSHLYASVLFTNMVSPSEAERMFRIFKSLTYREICILATLADEAGDGGLRTNCHHTEAGSDDFASLMQECFELEGRGLLAQTNHDQAPFYGQPSWLHVIPANLRVTSYGMRIIKLSGLLEIPGKDTNAVRELMRR